MDSHGSATPAPVCGVSLATLAEQRGVSKDAARRLVRSGKIEAHQVHGEHGLEWCVHLDTPVEARHGGAGDAPPLHQASATVASGVAVAGLVALVDRLTVENRGLAVAAAVWQERARVLADQLALTAPQQSQESSGEPDPPEPTPEPAPRPAPFPWPLPPSPNVRALLPWLLTMLALVVVVGLLA